MKICLISAVHLWINPRLVKEADAFTREGHQVTVITISNDGDSDKIDEEFCKTSAWKAIRINLLKNNRSGYLRWFLAALRQKFFFEVSKIFQNNLALAEEAYCRGHQLLLRQAVRNKADFYIAHTQAALPIAAHAARFHGVSFGFDCEDLNADTLADGLRDPQIRKNIKLIERAYLKGSSYVSATSVLMAEFLSKEYDISPPIVIHNVFSKKELEGVLPPKDRPVNRTVSLVWISAVIGQDRGLETAIEAMKYLPDCQLHIFGRFVDEAYEKKLKGLVDSIDSHRIRIYPIISSKDILREMSKYDIGLALEGEKCFGRSLTLTNKFFIYMQSGLAIAATDISGQKMMLEKYPDIGFLIKSGDRSALVNEVSKYCMDRTKLSDAKQRSWQLGISDYNWENESKKLFSCLEAVNPGG